MDQENIIKKEGKIQYKKSFFSNTRGELVLTTTELYHQDRKSKKLVSIPVKDIINVRTAKGASTASDMYVTYRAEGKEQTAHFMYFSLFNSSLAMGELARVQANYFAPWQQAIEELRSGKKSNGGNVSELEQLATLKDKGIITEAEFTAKKKQLLGL